MKRALMVLFLLLALDSVFILLNVLYLETHLLSDPRFRLSHDGGYAEIFGYLMESCIVLALCALAVRTRQYLYFAWAMLFLYILLDDSLLLHERVLGPLGRAFLGLAEEDMVLG